jgi:hypothetical protein
MSTGLRLRFVLIGEYTEVAKSEANRLALTPEIIPPANNERRVGRHKALIAVCRRPMYKRICS